MKNIIKLSFALLLTIGLYSNSFGQWIPGPPPEGYYPIYRLYKGSTGKFLVTSTLEAQNLTSTDGWTNEGLLGYSKSGNGVPIYRFYNGTSGHYFSTNSSTPTGYVYEGIAAYGALGQGPLVGGMGRAVYRYTKIKNGSGHFYTTDYNELGGGNSTWQYHGIAFYLFIL